MSIAIQVRYTVILVVLLLCSVVAAAQVRIYGTVYDRSARFGMSGVSVRGNTGAGTVTDSLGRYSIMLHRGDSVSFSYQGKSTQWFPVNEIQSHRAFDMSIHVDIQTLPTVVVAAKPRTFRFDSLERRNEYRKVFEFAPEYLTTGSGFGAGAGVNLDALFSMRKIKRMEAFREFLIQDEQDKYVDYRFNKELVSKITGLESPALEFFMKEYRPNYWMIQSFRNEYEFYKYIKDAARSFGAEWKREHPYKF
ncbi:hypothetical protein [Chitinophaga solisilvae]|uniref:Uncharacterized protein n=1 Tax=Chitinophaga solisilvae TaxID=1233460 RepID=A0A3S1B3W1_9BACT|nr:hypothetical protein [Chitinophaga solisilvae]NSL86335.1 hypothetical protein [Chitinophaga solisilvae]